MNDLVKLRITDSADPGRDAEMVMGRERAEGIVLAGLASHWPRFQFEVGPIEGKDMGKLKAAFAAVGSFLWTHKSEVAAVAAWAVALPLPTPYHQLATLLSAALAGFAGTKYGS